MSAVRSEAATRRAFAWRREVILVMLMLAYLVNYIDRNILNLLLPAIKAEFHLKDTELGFLSGTSFAIIYATLGVPVAWLADRASRRNIIAGSMLLFSGATFLSGLSRTFGQLVIARTATGVGEAGTSPAAHSIISDLYEPGERAAALSLYSAGLNIGMLVAFFAGGWIEQRYGWRMAFMVAGGPGLLLALAFLIGVPEPTRGHVDQVFDDGVTPSLWRTLKFLWAMPSFRFISIGAALSSFGGYSGQAFLPTFFARSHHLAPAQIGLTMACLAGVVGGLGTYLSGVVADRLSRRDVRWNLYVPVISACVAAPMFPVYFLSHSLGMTLLGAVLPAANGAVYLAPCSAMVQRLAPLRMRAQASAIFLFILNMIGFGLGPLTIGALSDALAPRLGEDSLRWAMLATAGTLLMAAACYALASLSLRADVDRARSAPADWTRTPT